LVSTENGLRNDNVIGPSALLKLLNSNCRPVLAAKECATRILSSAACQFTDNEHPRVVELQKVVAASTTAVDFVCRDNVEGISQSLLYLLISYSTI